MVGDTQQLPYNKGSHHQHMKKLGEPPTSIRLLSSLDGSVRRAALEGMWPALAQAVSQVRDKPSRIKNWPCADVAYILEELSQDADICAAIAVCDRRVMVRDALRAHIVQDAGEPDVVVRETVEQALGELAAFNTVEEISERVNRGNWTTDGWSQVAHWLMTECPVELGEIPYLRDDLVQGIIGELVRDNDTSNGTCVLGLDRLNIVCQVDVTRTLQEDKRAVPDRALAYALLEHGSQAVRLSVMTYEEPRIVDWVCANVDISERVQLAATLVRKASTVERLIEGADTMVASDIVSTGDLTKLLGRFESLPDTCLTQAWRCMSSGEFTEWLECGMRHKPQAYHMAGVVSVIGDDKISSYTNGGDLVSTIGGASGELQEAFMVAAFDSPGMVDALLGVTAGTSLRGMHTSMRDVLVNRLVQEFKNDSRRWAAFASLASAFTASMNSLITCVHVTVDST